MTSEDTWRSNVTLAWSFVNIKAQELQQQISSSSLNWADTILTLSSFPTAALLNFDVIKFKSLGEHLHPPRLKFSLIRLMTSYLHWFHQWNGRAWRERTGNWDWSWRSKNLTYVLKAIAKLKVWAGNLKKTTGGWTPEAEDHPEFTSDFNLKYIFLYQKLQLYWEYMGIKVALGFIKKLKHKL